MSEVFNVEWSKDAIIITVLVLVVIGGIAVNMYFNHSLHKLVNKIILASILVSFIVTVCYIPLRISIVDNVLCVHRVLGKKEIPLNDIKRIRIFEGSMPTKIFASGGFCGNIGWYRASSSSVYFSYVLNKEQAFYLVLKDGSKYILSCEDFTEVVAYVEKFLNHRKN